MDTKLCWISIILIFNFSIEMAEECLRNCPHKIDGSKVDTRKAIPREEIVSEYRDGYR